MGVFWAFLHHEMNREVFVLVLDGQMRSARILPGVQSTELTSMVRHGAGRGLYPLGIGFNHLALRRDTIGFSDPITQHFGTPPTFKAIEQMAEHSDLWSAMALGPSEQHVP